MQTTEEKMRSVKRMTTEEAMQQLQNFTNEKDSLMLATVSKEGEPFASYAPFVEDEDHNYYVYVSAHVQHSANMVETQKASVLLIDDESASANVFARKRFYAPAKAEKFSENDTRTEKIDALFEKKFGNKAKMVITMEDFRIYKLTPHDASLVLGFGAAFRVSDDRKTLTPKTAKHQVEHEENL